MAINVVRQVPLSFGHKGISVNLAFPFVDEGNTPFPLPLCRETLSDPLAIASSITKPISLSTIASTFGALGTVVLAGLQFASLVSVSD